ncbi:MAG: MGMT family protein [Bryobacteraceae bacterium]
MPAHVRAIRETIRRIPKGKVATYGQVAEAAGFPTYHRQVVQVLKMGGGLPWQRVLAAGGLIRQGMDQRTLLEMEGVRFKGRRVDMAAHQFNFARKIC